VHRNATRGACKGVWYQRDPSLSALGSLRFPQSFPYDFMHLILIWENLILNLVCFWSGCDKGMHNSQPYILAPNIWQAVGAMSAQALKTIPLLFSVPIPNPAKDCSYFISLMWSVWSLFITPTMLQDHFSKAWYSAGQLNMVNFLAPELRGFWKNRVWNHAQAG